MDELLAGVMAAIAEVLFEAFFEIVCEGLASLLTRGISKLFKSFSDINPVATTFALGMLGALVGLLSVVAYAAHTRAQAKREAEDKTRRAREDDERKRLAVKNRPRAKRKTESPEILASISELLLSCGAQATEMIRAARALNGTEIEEPNTLVLHDIAAILIGFRNTQSSGDKYIERLWRGIAGRHLRTKDKSFSSLYDCAATGEKPLRMVLVLAMHDELQRTNLASSAASTYLALVSEVSSHCGDSLAVKLVTDAYVELLRPYIHESRGDGYAGRSTSSAGSKSARKSVCQRCHKALELIGLPLDASAEDVSQKRRACAEVLHPDQLGSKSEKARDAAEQQLKTINSACDQILGCRYSCVAG